MQRWYIPPTNGAGGFFIPEGGSLDTHSTRFLADTAVCIAILSLAGSLLLALVGLGRQVRRRS